MITINGELLFSIRTDGFNLFSYIIRWLAQLSSNVHPSGFKQYVIEAHKIVKAITGYFIGAKYLYES